MKNWIVVACLLLLVGCVGSRMKNGLDALMGGDIKWAVQKLGYPDGEREIMGTKLYVWSTDHIAYLPVANTTTGLATGNVGGTPVTMNSTQTSWGVMPIHASCVIQLAVDKNGNVSHYQWRGNPAGCAPYANALYR